MRLQKAVEEYSMAWRMNGQPRRISDEDLAKNVHAALVEYYRAHLPLKDDVVGPENMVDPDYLTYRLLCRKYKIEPGTFLHEVKL